MATDPRSAFQVLIQAWEEFHAAVIDTEDAEAPRVLRASERLADAYTIYDDVIFTSFGVEAPFDTYDDDDDFDDEDADFGDTDVDADFDEDFDDDFDDFDDDDEDFDDASEDVDFEADFDEDFDDDSTDLDAE